MYYLSDQKQVPVCCIPTHVTATSSACQPNFPGCTTALMNSARFYSAQMQLSALIWRCVYFSWKCTDIILRSCTTCFCTVNRHNAAYIHKNKYQQQKKISVGCRYCKQPDLFDLNKLIYVCL